MHLETLKRKLRKRYQEASLTCPKPFTLDVVWMASVLTKNGEKPFPPYGVWELNIAASDPREFPWGNRLCDLKPNTENAKVLLVGRPGPNYRLIDSGIVARVAAEHGLEKPEIVCSNRLSTFWPNFFGQKLFLTRPVKIPSLIVSPGYSSISDDSGMNWQMDVRNFLDAISESWGIPVKLVEDPV